MIESYLVDKMFKSANSLDELVTQDNKVADRWQKLVGFYANLSTDKMSQYYEEVSRQLRENGVTYNVFGDPEGMNRPWMLDPVPMVFSAEDWATIEKGLIQRAELLNLLLADIYGPRHLIKEGLIPFELIYNHKGFLRQADKIKLDGEHQLIQYAADMARGPDGKMWILRDRTDVPSGAGYTFENRAAMTRVFPNLIRENAVRKISSYYQTLKDTLVHLSSKGDNDDLRIVLLSPGPKDKTYFEHAYLSSFMGFTLAFGEDLAVNDGYVWLKTIKGLEKVDVIIRRVEDIFCDPMEFRNDSNLGVVGLMESIRQKKVIVVNPFGSRILENPGLMAFLPQLCEKLLGEELLLPSVATWWCGHDKEKQYVLENIQHLIIRKIYRGTDSQAMYGGEMTSAQLKQLSSDINRSPYLYVAQEMVEFSTTPSWINNRLEGRNAIFRSYIVADTENNTYNVMPGGLSRSSVEKDASLIISNQSGGLSKDTWVIGKKGEELVRPKTKLPEVSLRPETKNVLPSRTGEHLFWMGRYMERAACTVRLMRMVLKSYNEADEDIHIKENDALSTLSKSLTAITDTKPGFFDKTTLKDPEGELIALALDISKPGSLTNSIQAFLSNGYSIRDRLSLDTWRILDSISEESNRMRKMGTDLTQIYGGLDSMIIKLMAFYGLNIDNMTRAATWDLLNIGRFIESAISNCTLLGAMLGKPFERDTYKALMEGTLQCSESLVTYRYKYRSVLELKAVLDLLICNEDNPRSLIYQVLKIDKHLRNMPHQELDRGMGPVAKKLLGATTAIRLSDIDHLSTLNGAEGKYLNLLEFLDHISSLLMEISDMIFQIYFSNNRNRYHRIQTATLPEI